MAQETGVDNTRTVRAQMVDYDRIVGPIAGVSPNDPIIQEMQKSVDLLNQLKPGVSLVSGEIQNALKYTKWMYAIIFALGVGLIVTAAAIGFATGNNEYAAILGGVGIIQLVTVLLKDPTQQLQKSRACFAKLEAAYYTWLFDLINWSVFLYNFSHEGQDCKMQLEDMRKASDSYIESFRDSIGAVGACDDSSTTTPSTTTPSTTTPSTTTPSNPPVPH